ncbi:hypothetical protein T492DRAFT_600528 [Pavlovales sp. CCMP2436]|nr:hypothetical protein T492DRAFT_600528 [Pavlovales sp. CCMP2436]|mmetsp:Transcript_25536/g.64884  ORF Transcript_25536/g.64884 Transcript_25536/m.64884 type:complete len:195 (-) Transcript_25536:128-712(-)|eukprot:CAMPEP_0179942784 /NCGR_PEP_ID=MMETSP0983-20121128/17876_1 /TAXON_ID=483367 /ORGANISM="non described non described, Strain CCMP 2436" /LENGTH=194 /DNA_ID=CAMNT_0021850259 /DNA_START=62 /DNA_END=646 /DNA_ORIENTATION=+
MGISDRLLGLKTFASSWWYPWVVGMLSCVNTFTVVLSGPLVILYVAGVLANGAKLQRRLTSAVANALGTTIGAAMLIALIEQKGVQSVTDAFPTIFASKSWERSKGLIEDYGFLGTIGFSAMPIVLHPGVIFALTAGMNRATILAAVMIGRTIKYTVMAQLAVGAPHLLRFFGHRGEAKITGAAPASRKTPKAD